MSLNTTKVPESHVRLMQAIGLAIQQHTLVSPMTSDDIAGILGFCAGAAIANGKSPARKSESRQMVIANIDHAMQAWGSQPQSAIILPFSKG